MKRSARRHTKRSTTNRRTLLLESMEPRRLLALIAHYTFDGDTGNTAVDHAGGDNPLTISATSSFVVDPERVEVLNNAAGASLTLPSTTQNYTFSGFYKGTDVGYFYDQSDRFIASVESSTNQDLNDADASSGLGAYDGTWHNSLETEANDGEWHHLAWVFQTDGLGPGVDSYSIYVDGVAVDVDPAAGGLQTQRALTNGIKDLSSNPNQMLFSAHNGGAPLIGLFDDVRIYDHALDASEIAALALVVPPDNLDPVLSFVAPADDSTRAGLNNFKVRFNEPVALGTGNVTIRNLTDNTQVVIDVANHGGQLSTVDNDLVISPAADLDPHKEYEITIDPTAIDDPSGNSFVGIAASAWNFTTGVLNVDFSQNDETPLQGGYRGFAFNDTATHTVSYPSSYATDGTIEVTIDGNTHYRDYAPITSGPFLELTDLLSDSVLRNAPGVMTMTFSNLNPGAYELITYHHATQIGNSPFDVSLTDANVTNQVIASQVIGSAGTAPTSIVTLSTIFVVDAGVNGGNVDLMYTFADMSTHVKINGFDLVETTIDTDPPTRTALDPPDNAVNASPTALEISFDEPVVLGTGNITIRNLTDNTNDVINVANHFGQLAENGTSIAIMPAVPLDATKQYAILIDPTAIVDLAGNAFTGIADDTTWNFSPAILKVDFSQTDETPLQLGYQGFAFDDAIAHTVFYSSPFATSGTIDVTIDGNTHYRDYAAIASGPFFSQSALLSDSVLNNVADGVMTLTLGNLNPGNYEITTYHHATQFDPRPFDLALTDGTVTNQAIATGVVGSFSTAPTDILTLTTQFTINSAVNGGAVSLAFTSGSTGNQVKINGFDLLLGEVDTTPPEIVATNPADNSTGAGLNNLVASFDEPILLGTGNIALRNLTDNTETLIDAANHFGQLAVSGTNLIIMPAVNLDPNDDYAIRITPTAVTDLTGNAFAGIADDTTWNFTTAVLKIDFSQTDDTPLQPGYQGFSFNDALTHTVSYANPFATDGTIEVTIDGNTHYRDYAAITAGPFVSQSALLSDSVLNNAAGGVMTLTLDNLNPGNYTITTYHHATQFEPRPFDFALTDGNVTNQTIATGVVGSFATAPTEIVTLITQFTIDTAVNGGAVSLAFTSGATGNQVKLNGFDLLAITDVTAPLLASLSPTDGETDVAVAANLVATFDESVALGTGNITINNLTDNTSTTIDVANHGGQLSLNGAALTINPAADLLEGKSYAIRFEATTITDLAGNPFAGVADNTTWNFVTVPPPLFAAPDDYTASHPIGENGMFDSAAAGAPGLLDNDSPAGVTLVGINGTASLTGTSSGGGTVSVNSNGSFTYNPNGQFESLGVGASATDTFTYTVTDGVNGTSTNTVTLQIDGANDPPVAQVATTAATEGGAAVSGSFNADDVDNDDDPASLIYAITSNPGEGMLTNNDGTFSFDPGGDFQDLGAGATRVVSFDYTATDSNGAVSNTSTVQVTVTGVNDAPSLTVNSPTATTDEGQTVTNSGTFADLDTSDTLTITPSTGTISRDPGNAGNWTWFLFAHDGPSESQTVTITATDSQGVAATVSFDLTVSNVAPTATISGPIEAAIGVPVSFTLGAIDPSTPDQISGFSFTVDWGDGSPSQTVPPAAPVHTYQAEGLYTITVTATDKDGGVGQPVTHLIEVINEPVIQVGDDIVVTGTSGSDRIIFTAAGAGFRVRFNDQFYPLDGSFFSVNANTHLIADGLEGSDTIIVFGTLGAPAVFDGGEGNDYLAGGTDNDTLIGGAGNDILLGGEGDNRLEGGDGNDRAEGRDGADLIFGGSGNDRLNGGAGNDIIDGGSDNDLLMGGLGDDLLLGRDGADNLNGYYGNDVLYGGNHSDQLFGGNDQDLLFGGLGSDRVRGDGGDDTLVGGTSALEADTETSLDNLLAGGSMLPNVQAALDAWFASQSQSSRMLYELFGEDSSTDELIGGSGSNTFQTGSNDLMRDLRSGDTVL